MAAEGVPGLRERLGRFIEDEVIPAEPRFFAEQEETGYWQAPVLAELRQSAKRQGLWALGHPAEIGGGGLSFMDFVYLNEIIGRSELGQFAVGSGSMQDCIMLHRYGTEEQKQQWLLPMVRGEIFPSVGLTEPEVAGSDPTLIRSRARFDGDEIVVDAHKWFTSGATNAAFTTIFAETDPDAQSRHRRFSAIIVPTGTPGYRIERVVPTMGHTGGGHCEIRLDGVRVPAGNLLGGRGEGFVIAQRRLGPGRIFHCMRWLGQAQRAFELMVDRANSRYAHGSQLAEKGEIRRYIAESAAQIQAHRLMTLDAARRLDAGADARVEIGLIKFHGAAMLHDVIDRAIQVHGALGVTSDTPLERMYREARYARIYDGPDEVHRMSVARRLLKDPASAPWVEAG
ncbi:acyl-CoA dehydrogenase [Amycolatopsis sp. K13G38]|uniref:Acyl-CoA dehydrogenase n=1 Tax=Amycolatopsis acididurans TaxID=2724524 RepID=A0ABX1J086_9PSEU|nr:acyl-CoA dehydrogenase family protein [Amycolatopsis acididurans]NKQ53188.1 acyl-CoA dehydrogenase [Amycolatopsis acididurans]